jgi:hypothetical protein
MADNRDVLLQQAKEAILLLDGPTHKHFGRQNRNVVKVVLQNLCAALGLPLPTEGYALWYVLTHRGSEEDVVVETEEEINSRLEKEYLSRIEAGDIPSIKDVGLDWDDVGGYDAFVQYLQTRVHGQGEVKVKIQY